MERVWKFGIWAHSELGIGHDVRRAFQTGGIRTWGHNRAVKTNRLVCLSVCLCVSDWHFYPSTLTDFDKTWSQGPYSDLVWPRP